MFENVAVASLLASSVSDAAPATLTAPNLVEGPLLECAIEQCESET